MNPWALTGAAMLVVAATPAPSVAASFCSPPLQPACMVVGDRNANETDARRCQAYMSAYEEHVRGYISCLRGLIADQESLLARISKPRRTTSETSGPRPSLAR